MKKNFFKKLALVMALAITVTSVPATNASAAAAPGFKSSAVKVNVGQTKKYNTANANKYSVKFKIGNKKVATINYSAGSKAVKVTGVAEGKSTLRADFKSYSTKRTTTVRVPVTVIEAKQVITAKQSGAKTFEVTATKALAADTKVSVKKGNIEVALAEKTGVQIATDGKKVVITSAAKLTAGDYTITLGELTATVKAEDETVAAINFLSDKAVLQPKDASNRFSLAQVTYKIYNQFKEDVTDTTKAYVQITGSEATSKAAGKIEFKREIGYNLNDVVAAVVIYRKDSNVVTQTGTFAITNEAVVNEITVKDAAYNADKKVLSEDTDLAKDAFYILFSAKDQYGNDMSALKTQTASGGQIIVNFAGGITSLTAKPFANDTVTTLKVDGVDYFAIRLEKESKAAALTAGTATTIIVSTGTGKTANVQTKVELGSKIDSITLQFPDVVVGGENNEVSYTAVDSYGKAVTGYAALKGVTGILVEDPKTTSGLWVKEDVASGTGKLFYRAASTTVDTMGVITLLTKTFKSSNYTVSIKRDAVATAITGSNELTTGKIVGESFTLENKNIVVVDQYGRKDKLDAADYVLKATTLADGAAFDPTSAIAKLNDTQIAKADKLTAKATDGTSKIRFDLYSADGSKVISDYTVTFTGAPQENIKSYTVADLGTMYSGSGKAGMEAYAKTVEVSGLLSDGTKIALPADQFNMVVSGNLVASGSSIKAKDGLTETNKPLYAVDTITEKVTVIVNKTGDEFVKEVVIAKAAPKVVSVTIADDATTLDITGEVNAASVFDKLIIKDQYGVELKKDTAPTNIAQYKDARLTLTGDKITVTNNGTSAATTVALAAKSVVTVKITFADGFVYTAKAVTK